MMINKKIYEYEKNILLFMFNDDYSCIFLL